MPRVPSPRPSPVFPWITAGLCLVMLLLHAFLGPTGADPAQGPQRLALLDAGAKSASLVSDASEGWRVLSAHLVHTGWVHLVFNIAFFFPVAAALECVLMRVDFALSLALIAISSGLASLVWTPEISAGASGLVYGVLGCAVLVGLRFAPQLRGRIRLHFGLWVLPFLLLILFFGANNPNLDHHNHLGGLMAGLALVPLVRLRPRYDDHIPPELRRRQSTRRAVGLTLLLALTVYLAPHLVRTLAPARVLTCMGTVVNLPASWGNASPAENCDGGMDSSRAAQVSVPNTSTMVGLELTRIPFDPRQGLQWRYAWEDYRSTLADPRAPRASVRSWSEDCDDPLRRPDPQRCTQGLTYVRESVAMQAQVHWYRGLGHWLAVRFEAPVHWWDKYALIRRGILDSVRPQSTGPRPDVSGTIVRAAIP